MFPEGHGHPITDVQAVPRMPCSLGLRALPMLLSHLEHLSYTGKGKGKCEKVTTEVVPEDNMFS